MVQIELSNMFPHSWKNLVFLLAQLHEHSSGRATLSIHSRGQLRKAVALPSLTSFTKYTYMRAAQNRYKCQKAAGPSREAIKATNNTGLCT